MYSNSLNDKDEENNHRFYGPETGCNDLGRLGFTLNGYYLVHGRENQSSNGNKNNQIEVAECRFVQKSKLENKSKRKKNIGKEK